MQHAAKVIYKYLHIFGHIIKKQQIKVKFHTHVYVCLHYLFYEVNVMKCPMFKLGSTTRKSKVVSRNFYPILVALNFSKLGVWNIVIPYLQDKNLIFYGPVNGQTETSNEQNLSWFLPSLCF